MTEPPRDDDTPDDETLAPPGETQAEETQTPATDVFAETVCEPKGAVLDSSAEPTAAYVGAYEILGEIARGGQGVIFRARHTKLGTVVALKMLLHPAQESIRRFEQEAKVLAQLRHPNLPIVSDLGLEGGKPFLAMEFIEGVDLTGIVASRGIPPFDWTVKVLETVARTLHYCHEQKIVHRDVKPANILIEGATGRPLLVDFGLVKHTSPDDGATDLSIAGEIKGTPAYMAPEQADPDFGEIGAWTDVYALGGTLYYLLTGVSPFRATNTLRLLMKVMQNPPPDPLERNPDIPATLARLCLGAMSKAPTDRPSSAAAFADALKEQVWDLVPAGLESRERPFPQVKTPGLLKSNLPAQLGIFIGRKQESEAITSLLAQANVRVLTLVGTVGTGKTRLAQRFAAQHLSEYPGGVWCCDLTGTRELEGLCSAVAKALDVPLTGDDLVDQLAFGLQGRGRTLIILDNVQQAAASVSAVLGRWLEVAPEAVFLVTSRVALGLSGEQLYQIEPFAVPEPADSVSASDLEHNQAVALFVARAQEVKSRFALTDANASAVGEVVRRLDGIPLALELAAARVRILSPQKIVQRLRRRFDLLATQSRDLTTRSTLRGAIDESWELLEPWERAALAQVSVFRGGFGLEAAEAVLDLSAWPDAPFPMDVVEALADKNVLRAFEPSETQGEVRFAMYESIREYAAEKLETPGEVVGPGGEGASGEAALAAAQRRHGTHYADLGCDAFASSLSGADGVALLETLALDLENLQVAVERAISASEPHTVAGACVAAQHVLALRGPFSAAVRLASRALCTPDLPPSRRPQILLAQAVAQRHLGQPGEARAASQEALDLAKSQGDRRREGLALGILGILSIEQGQAQEATARFQAAMSIHRSEGHRRLEGIARRSLGSVDYLQGNMAAAGEHYQAALEILTEVGDRREVAKALLNLGGWHGEQGQMDQANRCSEAALAAAREVGDRRSEGIILLNLGHHCQDKGLLVAAKRLFEDALNIFRDIGDRISQADTRVALGALTLALGEGSSEHYEAGLRIYREAGNRASEGLALGRLGEMELSEGRPGPARERLEAAVAILRDVNDVFYGGVFLSALAELQADDDTAQARESLDQAEELLRDVGEQAALVIHLCRRGRIEQADGKQDAARVALEEADELAKALDASEDSSVSKAVVALREALA